MTATAVNTDCDIKLTIPAGVTLAHGSRHEMKFVLSKDQGQRAMYRRASDHSLVSGTTDIDAVIVKSDWSGGFGAYTHNADKPNRYGQAVSMDCSVPGKVILGPYRHEVVEAGGSASFTDVVEANAEFSIGGTPYLFIGNGRYFYRLDNWSTTPVFTQVKDIGVASESKSFCVWQERLFAAIEGTNKYLYTADGSSWSQNGGSGNPSYANRFGVINGALHKMRGQGHADCVALAGATGGTGWSGESIVGDICYLHEILGMDGATFIAQEDGLYSLDGMQGRANDLIPELKRVRHVDNGQRACVWHNRLFHPTTFGTLWMVQGRTPYKVQPQLQVEGELELGNVAYSQIGGPIRAMAIHPDWLYASIQRIGAAGSNHRLIKLGEDNDGNFTWFNVAEGEYAEQGNMWVTSGSTSGPVLWCSQGVAYNYHLAYYILPKGGDPTQDSRCRFQSSGTLYEPWMDYGVPGDFKRWLFVEIWINLPLNTAATVTATGDDGTTGINAFSLSNGYNRVPFIAGFNPRKARLTFVLSTDDRWYTPSITQYNVHAQVVYPNRYSFFATVDVGNTAANGLYKIGEVIDFLQDLMESDRAVTLTDMFGDTWTVIARAPTGECLAPKNQAGRWEMSAQLSLLEDEAV